MTRIATVIDLRDHLPTSTPLKGRQVQLLAAVLGVACLFKQPRPKGAAQYSASCSCPPTVLRKQPKEAVIKQGGATAIGRGCGGAQYSPARGV
ncbi:hypothetical protein NDU88_004875 [Pleurodeles waltl]|uniref:Uncharacterized protein n=1 Tax=Pleurodeles waltl TaxID=8319 RepID=A0AAV7UGF3_PLEWA|nr:hypothetical protein NDU88_004875 [Pleurodeles waltl]